MLERIVTALIIIVGLLPCYIGIFYCLNEIRSMNMSIKLLDDHEKKNEIDVETLFLYYNSMHGRTEAVPDEPGTKDNTRPV